MIVNISCYLFSKITISSKIPVCVFLVRPHQTNFDLALPFVTVTLSYLFRLDFMLSLLLQWTQSGPDGGGMIKSLKTSLEIIIDSSKNNAPLCNYDGLGTDQWGACEPVGQKCGC